MRDVFELQEKKASAPPPKGKKVPARTPKASRGKKKKPKPLVRGVLPSRSRW